jgi:radical SAM superfamily enzyme YgiQ (UPF0313 family)
MLFRQPKICFFSKSSFTFKNIISSLENQKLSFNSIPYDFFKIVRILIRLGHIFFFVSTIFGFNRTKEEDDYPLGFLFHWRFPKALCNLNTQR